MNKIIPKALSKGDNIRIIAPSRSLSIIGEKNLDFAVKLMNSFGYSVSFGKNVKIRDRFDSSPIESRITDLHEAFNDNNVNMISTVIGGFNSNQLLDYIDFDLIKNNPKIFCGYSDITALNNAIFAKTGLINFNGPHISTFGIIKGNEFTVDHFLGMLTSDQEMTIKASENWSNDAWFADQINRNFIKNEGYWILNEGHGEGTVIGGNLCTFNLLLGTQYCPSFKNTILFIEDDADTNPTRFDRDLQSIIHQDGFKDVKGLVIGRFEQKSRIDKEILKEIIYSKTKLKNMPVIANVDFGHTDPKLTIPIGGTCQLSVKTDSITLTLAKK